MAFHYMHVHAYIWIDVYAHVCTCVCTPISPLYTYGCMHGLVHTYICILRFAHSIDAD